LASVYRPADDALCAVLDKCRDVSLDLLRRAPAWLSED
jgi:hypothetical protein